MKTPPLDRADNGRLFDDTEDDGFKTPGSLGYWSQGLNIPAKKIVITIKLYFFLNYKKYVKNYQE